MKIQDIKIGDVVTAIYNEGPGFTTAHAMRVLNVNKETVTVRDYYGHKFRIRPECLERKIHMTLDEYYKS